jgi:hypothetical protein
MELEGAAIVNARAVTASLKIYIVNNCEALPGYVVTPRP